jgi:hypothetical protein
MKSALRQRWRQHNRYGPKYPEISKIRCVGLLGKTLMDLLMVGTIARFEVTTPSSAFSVDTTGMVCPSGHSVMYPSGPGGTTATLSTSACAVEGIPQALALTATFSEVMGGDPGGCRVSTTRQGVTPYSDRDIFI